MIYIGTDSESGGGIYLDVHTVVRSRRGQELTAVIGDGHYEGEVLIALGARLEVTFVDALWGDASGLRSFLEHYGEEKIRADLRHTLTSFNVDGANSDSGRGSRPHVYLPLFTEPGGIAEKTASPW